MDPVACTQLEGPVFVLYRWGGGKSRIVEWWSACKLEMTFQSGWSALISEVGGSRRLWLGMVGPWGQVV